MVDPKLNSFGTIVWAQYWKSRGMATSYGVSFEKWFNELTGYHMYDLQISFDEGLSFNTDAPDDFIIQTILTGEIL